MTICVTGALGLVGTNVTKQLVSAGERVVGIDNNARADFFGPDGSTSQMAERLSAKLGANFTVLRMDIRDEEVFDVFKRECFSAVVHCAAQPSHDWAAEFPLEDFSINAIGTLHVLEATRRFSPDAVFVLLSTNKIYGAELGGLFPVQTIEKDTRFEFADVPDGVHERFPTDHNTKSLYGVSKLAADAAAQEYGRYYGLKTTCLRAGCITGAGHAAVQAHGFLSYLVRCNVEGRRYVVKGHKGKQVRDNIHAADLAKLIVRIIDAPGTPGQVFNVGGGGHNSCSILEAFKLVEDLTGKAMDWTYDPEARRGDQVCYYTDLRKVMAAYPGWGIKRDLLTILGELVDDWRGRA